MNRVVQGNVLGCLDSANTEKDFNINNLISEECEDTSYW